MIKAVINTQKYFQAPKNYFWRWGDNGEVLEWKDGMTISYRDELLFILKRVANNGLPPLGTILLILTACRDDYDESRVMGMLWDLLKIIPGEQGEMEVLEYHLHHTKKFLHTVSGIRKELRRRQGSMHLLDTVFEQPGFTISSSGLLDALDELGSGRVDALIVEEGEPVSFDVFKTDIAYLSAAAQKFPTVNSLELRLSTGLDKIPAPAEVPLPEPSSADLFDQLSGDPQTSGIARLARHIMAALSIPMHSQGSGDHSYGGIADITNRGNYDKLLLSELAQDDLLLTARLVNNEALYFRREEPPDNPKRQRTLLIDTTLKMWGLPRVFALAAALACAQTTRRHELVETYALGGDGYTEADLATKEGVIRFLELLHPALHCGKALEAAIAELPVEQQNEYLFITDAVSFANPFFQASLAEVRESLSFMITVSRDGSLQLYECIKGKTRLLNKARLDLDELIVVAPQARRPAPVREPSEYPVFISQSPQPLLFPVIRVKQDGGRSFKIKEIGLVTINEAQRVLYIAEKGKAAYELLNYIEKGVYAFGWDEAEYFYILVNNLQQNLFKLYCISQADLSVKSFILLEEILLPKEAVFKGNQLFIRTGHQSFLYDCSLNKMAHQKQANAFDAEFPGPGTGKPRQQMPPGWYHDIGFDQVMIKFKQLLICDDKLVMGNYTLDLIHGYRQLHFRVAENTVKKTDGTHAKWQNQLYRPFPNKAIKCDVWTWEDGSRAVIDSRGLLHLKSSDKFIPEITVVMITGTDSACWAADGIAAGNPRFIDEKWSPVIPATEFYMKYIQSFIRVIRRLK